MLDAQTYPINMIHIFFKILIINTNIAIQKKKKKESSPVNLPVFLATYIFTVF